MQRLSPGVCQVPGLLHSAALTHSRTHTSSLQVQADLGAAIAMRRITLVDHALAATRRVKSDEDSDDEYEREARKRTDGVAAAAGGRVYLDDEKQLHWPVMVLYPEAHQTDLIQDFNETHTFDAHLHVRVRVLGQLWACLVSPHV